MKTVKFKPATKKEMSVLKKKLGIAPVKHTPKKTAKEHVDSFNKWKENDDRWIPGSVPEKPNQRYLVTVQGTTFEDKPSKKIVTTAFFNNSAKWDINAKILAYMYLPKAYVKVKKEKDPVFAKSPTALGWLGTGAIPKPTKRVGLLSKLLKGKERCHKNDR